MTHGDVLALVPRSGTSTFVRLVANPHGPYRVLAWMCWASALICAAYWVFAGDDLDERPTELVSGVVLVVLGVLAWVAAPRLRGWWGLYVSAAIVGGACAVAAGTVGELEGQMVIGLGLMALGLLLAVFLPPGTVLVIMGSVGLAYFVGSSLNKHAKSVTTYAVVAGIVVVVSWLFSIVVTAMRDQALHDHVTGLLNRHGLDVLSGPLLATARRTASPVTVLVIDVDRFKTFNDGHGHPAGDELLRTVARSWVSACRDSDLVVRYGGDEVVVVLVGASPRTAEETAARARASFEAARPSTWTEAWTVGSTAVSDSEPLADAIRRADDRLIAAKQARGPAVPPQRPAI